MESKPTSTQSKVKKAIAVEWHGEEWFQVWPQLTRHNVGQHETETPTNDNSHNLLEHLTKVML